MLSKILKFWSLLLASLLALVSWILLTTPNAEKIKSCLVTENYKVSLCEKNKNYVRLSQVSRELKNTILIAEDAGFYGHKGFDWDELKNSLEVNWQTKRAARGGSTITQQLAKNVFLTFDKNILRKIREAILANELEQILTKDQIFEKYLNVIELGPNTFGISAAASKYFGKSAAELNLLESAFIAYLIPNPKAHYKTFQRQALTPYARRRILDLSYRMYRLHRIHKEQYEVAKTLVDEFPWKNLTSTQIALLRGEITSPDVTEQLPPLDTELPTSTGAEATGEGAPPSIEDAPLEDYEIETDEDTSSREPNSEQTDKEFRALLNNIHRNQSEKSESY